jgi:hypothetical protein
VAAPYASYLRVYEPLSAFPESQRRRWAARAADPAHPGREALAEMEHRNALRRLAAVPPVVVPPIDSAEENDCYVMVRAGISLVCPLDTRLRSFLSLDLFRRSIPDGALDDFIPPAMVAAVEAEFAEQYATAAPGPPRILTETWQVPMRWFVPFGPRERLLATADTAGERGLVYRTGMADARRRLARGLKVILRSVEDGMLDDTVADGVVDGVVDLGRWLEEFHPHSAVELDYGGLVHLLDDDALDADTSAADVQAALRALAAGDGEGAGFAYVRLVERWGRVRALQHAN